MTYDTMLMKKYSETNKTVCNACMYCVQGQIIE